MNRRIGAALAAIALTASIAAPANADGWPTPLPKPDPNDARIITMGGTITQEQADANAAAYAAVFPYIDQREGIIVSLDAYNHQIVADMTAQLTQRDIDCANALNAKQTTIDEQQQTIADLRARLHHKATKIADLRAIIRDLRDH